MASPSPALRHRATHSQLSTTPSTSDISPTDSEEEKKSRDAGSGQIGWGTAFLALFIARHWSATSNLIHDCDEVFNYWEPLHYLLYKSGFQTWEYSSEFALRSYLYLLIHAVVTGPASWLYGSGLGKVHVFYTLRLFLAFISAVSEAALVVAISSRYGQRLAVYTLMLLCFTSGCFNASTGFLPSSFSMYTVTLAVASLLFMKPYLTVIVAIIGVLVGWPFSILAMAPLVVYALTTGGFRRMMLVGILTSIIILVLSISMDYLFYGRWTSSVLNLVMYNVIGGGDSAIYGVETQSFYLRNGFNNFNFALVLALLFPMVAMITRKRGFFFLLILVSPLYLWLGFMSLQPHKEERFLFPVYPLICLAAAAVIESFPDMVPNALQHSASSLFVMVAKILRPLVLGIILVVSYSRTTALLNGYSAPLQVYQQFRSLEGDIAKNGGVVCIGSEWHRFPSSFFLPSPKYQVRWVDDGFRGLLPFPFNNAAGGTAAAPSYFNKMNQASSEQFLADEELCSYFVELDLKREGVPSRGSNTTAWEVVSEHHFLDSEKSPALHRAFFIPWQWQKSNVFGHYRFLKRKNI